MDVEEQTKQDEQDMQAGFSAGFSGEAKTEQPAPEPPKEPEQQPATAQTDEVQPEPAATETPPALTPEDIAKFRAASSTIETLQKQLDKAHGHIGSLNERLQTLATPKVETPPAKPAEYLKRIKEQYPEMGEALAEDLAEFAASLPKGTAPEDVTKLIDERVTEGVARGAKEAKLEIVRDVHPDFDEIVASGPFWDWAKSIPEELERVHKSASPVVINGVLSRFKKHLEGASQAKAKSQERLTGAITPQGEKRPAGRATLSDEEAMRKGFSEGFNS